MNIAGRARISALTVAAIALGGLAAWGFLARVRSPHLTPEQRGYALAEQLGCQGCHGPGGTGGVPNPGSSEGEIPAWVGGTAMMYIQKESEIREWIMDGKPWRLVLQDSLAARHRAADEEKHLRDSFPKPGEVRLRPRPLEGPKPPLHMPAFRNVINEAQLADLIAYYKAVAAFDPMPADVHEGYRAARSLGCFGCHGPGGLIGANNPRSFKGYIPPWRGPDFKDLVHNDKELHGWILDGGIPRLDQNRAARFFTSRQVIHMPAFRGVVADSTLTSIVTYIHWLSDPK